MLLTVVARTPLLYNNRVVNAVLRASSILLQTESLCWLLQSDQFSAPQGSHMHPLFTPSSSLMTFAEVASAVLSAAMLLMRVE